MDHIKDLEPGTPEYDIGIRIHKQADLILLDLEQTGMKPIDQLSALITALPRLAHKHRLMTALLAGMAKLETAIVHPGDPNGRPS